MSLRHNNSRTLTNATMVAIVVVIAVAGIAGAVAILGVGHPSQNRSSPTTVGVSSTTAITVNGNLRSFAYLEWNQSTPGSFTFENVKFTLWTNTTVTYSAGSCYGPSSGYAGYVITFSDGSSEQITTCTVGPNPPQTLRLTTHTNPQAGILIVPSTGRVFFLVSLQSGSSDIISFKYESIPPKFEMGSYTFAMVYNGTGYISSNGTQYMGFDVVLTVSRAGEIQIANFQWSPYGPGNGLPSPTSITLYGGDVVLRWSTNSSGLFLQASATTLPATYVAVSSTYRTQSASSSTTLTCIQTLSAPLYLIVKNDSGAPISNQPLSIQAHLLEGFAYNSTTDKCDAIRSTHIWMNETGSDGKIELGMTGDVFNITTNYLGRTYQVNAEAEGAESAECVTLSLPSGAVNTTFTGTYQC